MLSNFHTHTSFCDGKNAPEEIVLAAIEKGFSAIGFSGHGYTPYDLRYCMKNTDGYVKEIERLKEKYRSEIEIYLGVEEDAFAPAEREKFDYIIGSSHYLIKDGKYLPIDSSHDHFVRCLDAFDRNINKIAEVYYGAFCEYIKKRRPDVIGHFDLITKYSEIETDLFLGNTEYEKIAERYLLSAMTVDPVFEINTGAITRKIRSTVYPNENLLYLLKRENAKIMLSADSHEVATLDGCFEETKKYLYDIGFRKLMTISKGNFMQIDLT